MTGATPALMPPCPFCHAAGEIQHVGKLHFVTCVRCGAGSEPADTETLAVKNWRTRVRSFEARPSAWFPKADDGAIAA